MMAMSRGKCRVYRRVAALYGVSALSGASGGLIANGIQLVGERRGSRLGGGCLSLMGPLVWSFVEERGSRCRRMRRRRGF